MEETIRLMNLGKPLQSNESIGGPVVYLAHLYLQSGRPRKAEKLLREQIEREPDNDVYWLFLAWVYMDLQDLEGCKRTLDICLSVNPENEEALKLQQTLYPRPKDLPAAGRQREESETDVDFEGEYQDVLQNIEFAIIRAYRDHRDLLDRNVLQALESLIDFYVAGQKGRSPRQSSLSLLENLVSESMKTMCEWRLGRCSLDLEYEGDRESEIIPNTVDEIIRCLKRIRKSVKMWSKRGGKRGYLDFVDRFIV